MSNPVLGLQLYTVRDVLAQDFEGTVREVSEMGYDAVELTGTGPFDGAGLKTFLDELGLDAAGMHVGLDILESDLAGSIELAKALDLATLVCPYLPDERRGGRDDWLNTAQILDQMGEECRRQGVKLSYHNHSFEFVEFEGQYALDLLYENTSSENVSSELDTYWIQHGGGDPVEYVEKYGERTVILHLKDMADDEERSFTEVGNGILDWEGIYGAATAAGIQYYCVEQDTCPGDSLESARKSAEYLKSEFGLGS
ncbi:MAG: sugar phosphate isomerase/epimerase family protein [Candidatus Brocadiia bacterium]